MARIRNIKHSFFTNEVLAECDPLARLLFAGLWTIADREGRLEDRPKKIRAELLPYDDCDANVLLQQLTDAGFIIRYEVNGQRCIQITNFAKHQKPHRKEAKSVIPPSPNYLPPNIPDIDEEEEEPETEEAQLSPEKDSTSPEQNCASQEKAGTSSVGNGLWVMGNGELVVGNGEKSGKPQTSRAGEIQTVFAYWQEVHSHPNAKLDDKRKKAVRARLNEDFSVEDLKTAIDGCRASPFHQGQNDRNQVYDDLTLICRDAKHVEQFMGYVTPPVRQGLSIVKPPRETLIDANILSPKTRSNAAAGQAFIDSMREAV